MRTSPRSIERPDADLDVIVVGAGVGGLYAIFKMRELGLRVRAFEAASGVGGTWYWNRYPGCRCDVESLEYSYSFSPELEQEWHWDDRYATQAQILEYVEHVAQRFDLKRDVQFDTRVQSARFDSEEELWTITTDGGESVCAPYLVMAVGNLSTPRMPDYPGLGEFAGNIYHTGLWPHAGVDFSGQRVGVVGTGSSGVQSIPIIARQAEHLTVFQRTAQFVLPARNRPQDSEQEREHKATYRERRKAAFDTPFGIAGHPPPVKGALEASSTERESSYREKWAWGGQVAFLFSYNDLLTSKPSNDTAAEFVRERIRETVTDPKTAELLCPYDHPIGTKRLILDTDYFETYNLDHVDLVDVRNGPIERITRQGIKPTDAEYELDAIVFATGFDAMTGAMREIDIQAGSSSQIRDIWSDGPQTYLGVMMAEFPNLFMVTGPQSPGVKSQMIMACEIHVDFITECLKYMAHNEYSRIEASSRAQSDWVQHNNEVADATLYPLANSWYMGANIPGKPRVFMPYVGGVHNYQRKLDQVIADGFDGFALSSRASATVAAVQGG